ncbi:MAG: hypothetical protein CMI60_19245 [Parvibaculum sp.]|nr:hypothetical protein [Parvibaculum sp.]
MLDASLLRIGVAGTVIVALCCFTLLLVALVGVVGLSALTGYLDFVLFAALAFFIALSVQAVWHRQRLEIPTSENGDC